MIRDSLKKHYHGMNKEFRFRGEEPGRLENFSDAVFGLDDFWICGNLRLTAVYDCYIPEIIRWYH